MHINNLIKTAKDISLDFDFSGLQPFIIDSNLMWDVSCIKNLDESCILSTPFKLWSFEFSGGIINYNENTQGGDNDLLCVVVKEISPIEYAFLVFSKSIKGGKVYLTYVDKNFEKSNFDGYNIIKSFANFAIEKINSQKSGLISERIREKYKFKKKNYFYKCNNIIYISNNPSSEYIDGQSQFPINWHHSWHVRGHWRRLLNPETLGLDRMGERNIQGFTWINPYIKGEGKELIKIRKVK